MFTWKHQTGLLLLGILIILAGCSRGPLVRKTTQDDPMLDTEYYAPSGPHALPDPQFGEYGLESTTYDPFLSTDRGERIGNEAYSTSSHLQTVYFDFDKYSLRPDAAETLKNNAWYLLDNPHIRVLVEGHCDDRGSNEYNMSLGEKRAKEVRDYLIQTGVAPDRVKIISYGEEKPAAPNGTEEGWALNRRAEFKVTR